MTSKAQQQIINAKLHKYATVYLASIGILPDINGLYTIGDKKYKLLNGELVEHANHMQSST